MLTTGAALVAGVLTATVLAACGSSAGTTSDGRIALVAGENVWGDIAQQVGGDHVSVTSIITDPNTDPHEYETDPRDAAAVAGAKIVIENGVGYDDFLSKEVSTAGGRKQVLNVAALNHVGGDDPNPHLWYSAAYVTATAQAIEKQLAADDPRDAADFARNLQTFLSAYQPYEQTEQQIKARYGGSAISYTERVPGYLVVDSGLHLGTPAAFSQAVEDGTDPTPADTAAFDADITGHRVKALLYNSQVVDAQTTTIKQAAMSAGVPVVGVSETIPTQYHSFQAWQIAQARDLLQALGG